MYNGFIIHTNNKKSSMKYLLPGGTKTSSKYAHYLFFKLICCTLNQTAT